MQKSDKTKRLWISIVLLVSVIAMAVIIIHHNPLAIQSEEITKKVIACALILAANLLFIRLYDKVIILPIELFQNRKLIWKLSVNDFKTRYAGSYLGMVWAFVQPIVTILMYWFVFGQFMGQNKASLLGGGLEVPYVLYLTAGLIPWFFFTEALSNGTTALLEYNYLVKKVVFKISILPIIKIVAASFIHGFFVLFLLILCAVGYGYFPDIYTIQLLYYSFCLFIFVLGLSYATCSIVIFFRDLTQIISIVLQVGMWGTPILWQLSQAPEALQIIFKMNPIYYIVNGYRSALFEKKWFYEDFYSTMYFWIVTVVIFGVGALIFKRLKVHFADVL
ncbi:MAG: ABC transporter permease [Lachnospiraceae bacterium]|nr:ABC transporter permease [Lachnospiraceae bacterium]